ncbi:carbamate kinase [Desulfobacterota bacterium AH_259_B03_O07]|nr:carbamate kinase [Desulfobacterota bacterium AH_259_B03_O07]
MKENNKVAVVAFGGNALMGHEGKSTYIEQVKKTEDICRELLSLFDLGYKIVITHGNGPQVGNILMQQECLTGTIAPMPLDVCNAMTQGLIGYMIEQRLRNIFANKRLNKPVIAIVTQVVVSDGDPAFKNPTKFIGPFFSKAESERLSREEGWEMREDSGRGYRRVVPSPKPTDIVEKDQIVEMANKGFIVVACGGGGIPVLRDKRGGLKGVAAVIDKDFAAEKLASLIKAEILILVTPVDQVALFYGTTKQKNLSRITLNEVKRYFDEGHFPPGSMGPKIEAAMKFLSSGGEKTIITSVERLEASIMGEGGTVITQ